MNAKAWHLRKRDLPVSVLCVALMVLTLGAIGESGRRQAKEVVCQSNLHQWHGILAGYLQQNDGKFLSGDPGTPGYWWVRYLRDEHKAGNA
jgi:hypothetical protein